MNKRILHLLLCLMLIFCNAVPAFPVFADETDTANDDDSIKLTISTVDEFIDFANNCRLDSYSVDLFVTLTADINLSGTDFGGVPIFCGNFNGNGHTISGLKISSDGSAQGLFRYLTETSVVQNLNVQGMITPGGSRNEIGGIAGVNEGTIYTCSFTGTISGGSYVGGIAGTNAVTGTIENCTSHGNIYGNHFVGGIAGENNGVIRTSINDTQINTTPQQNTVEISDITLDTLTNSEASNTVTDIGGIAGISSGVIKSCKNQGNVGYKHMGYNIGGIAGTQSGYIVNCENHGEIQGRKEVGGIVGQMEPVSQIEYTEDTLQILQDQLGTMSNLVNQASSNASSNASQISGQISTLKGQAQTASDAVGSLLSGIESPDFSDIETPSVPDTDSILAAQNSLSSALGAMPETMNGIASATQNTISTLSSDLQAVSNQISVMSQTISNASDNLGGNMTDISDADTSEMLTGKVEKCTNYGSILADLNAGGITGAMAVENDLDITEDWESLGEESLNFQSEVRAVILNCKNQGTVTAKRKNGGGITGLQSLGLVKNCTNTGKLDAQDADYIGGISGQSNGFIRSCYAKCYIFGSSYVGGIAGSATIATNCRSMVLLTGTSEKLGMILGHLEDSNEENPVSKNYFLNAATVSNTTDNDALHYTGDIGAIDGISYKGLAEPLNTEKFFKLKNLPDLFKNASLRFIFEDGTEETITVEVGTDLSVEDLPSIPEKEGYVGEWEGLAASDLSNIIFDRTIEVLYTANDAAIATEKTRDNGLPILLVQGTFTSDAVVVLTESDESPDLSQNKTLLEAYDIEYVPAGNATAGRYLIPDGYKAKDLHIMLLDHDGQWTSALADVDGSYLVFDMNNDCSTIALVYAKAPNWLVIAIVSMIIVIAASAAVITKKKLSKRSSTDK